MTPKFRAASLFLFFTLFITRAYAQFPYSESFKNSTAPGIFFGGDPTAYLTAGKEDPEGEGYLRLTINKINQKGYIYSDAVLPSANGLKAEFEYYTYGGTGADGISFFLFDATATPSIGGFGGSLGYSQINTNVYSKAPGVNKGYLAIGLDEFGNFSNPNEGRMGGVGFKPGSVALRGKGDGYSTTDTTNYKYLTGVQTSTLGFALAAASKRSPLTSDPGYRKASIQLVPITTGGYSVTVKITTGGPSPKTYTVINNYNYPVPAPKTLRYGIASSTGAQTNFHEIRNVYIDVLSTSGLVAPVAKDDHMTLCVGEAGTVNVIGNDTTSNSGAAINQASIDLNPATFTVDKSLTVEGKGTFAVNTDGTITFTPANNSVSGEISIPYVVKDTYGVTSNQATITASVGTTRITATAGPDQTLIMDNGVGMSASLTAISTGSVNSRWSQMSGPSSALIQNFNSNNTTVTGLTEGTYVFKWTVSAGTPCESSDEVVIRVKPQPVDKLGLAKALTANQKASNGSYNLTYTFTLNNLGNEDLEMLSLKDHLANVFSGTKFRVTAIRTNGNLQANSAYNGSSTTELLSGNNKLAAGASATVQVDLNIYPTTREGTFNNTAFADGYSASTGKKVTDQSTVGLIPDPYTPGDNSPSEPTPVDLKKDPLFIPSGFSPNHDGIHDKFVIYNTMGQKVELEIYNRWGNRVYKSGDYQNDWEGRCTEGIHVGEDVPAGTYYYVVILDNISKYSGYLTINR